MTARPEAKPAVTPKPQHTPEPRILHCDEHEEPRPRHGAAMNHTPEPWRADRNCVFIMPGAVRWWIANTNTVRGASGTYATPIAEAETEAGLAPKHEAADADAARIVACVNACAGLDPAALPALIAAADWLIHCRTEFFKQETASGLVRWEDEWKAAHDPLCAALAAVRGSK